MTKAMFKQCFEVADGKLTWFEEIFEEYQLSGLKRFSKSISCESGAVVPDYSY
ncbi:Uncharacterised protein [Streptococcus pneumoniae]|uniref:hypothetical protein n=1 Tax=Streptococcus pneumoniae TaxID=1313 RepID=UPI0005E696AE|nr:hypothetical protein [Streptococcus pneumoniae]CMX38323.1 Uncharacterised protein [Streptococcus pneumoniae]